MIPVTVDDLVANGLLDDPHSCWERSAETFTARKDDIAGLALASHERIEAYLLYVTSGAEPEVTAEIVSLRSFVADDGARLTQLLSRLLAQGMRTIRMPKVDAKDGSKPCLEALGFHPAAAYRVYAARARSN